MEENLVQPLEEKKPALTAKFSPKLLFLGIVLAGLLSGFILSSFSSGSKNTIVNSKSAAGATNLKAFPDKAEGILQKGGIEGEGTHHLVMNPKDPSQTAYLTSTLVNLDDFVGKKVRVWGQTFTAQKAAWLMDVGRVEIIE